MKVYIVEGHIDHEGDDIISVHSTPEKAEQEKERLEAIIRKPYDERTKDEKGIYSDCFTVSEHEVLT